MSLCIVILFTGCQNNNNNNTALIVKVNGKPVNLSQVDVSKDTLISRKVDQDVDFRVEQSIFSPLMQDSNKVYAKESDNIKITFGTLPNRAILYDHLLQDDGKSYFNRSIVEHNITKDRKTIEIPINAHPSAMLSSDSNFLKDGSIRGFRLVTKTGKLTQEFAFVIHLTK
jgi:hypothetical protein